MGSPDACIVGQLKHEGAYEMHNFHSLRVRYLTMATDIGTALEITYTSSRIFNGKSCGEGISGTGRILIDRKELRLRSQVGLAHQRRVRVCFRRMLSLVTLPSPHTFLIVKEIATTFHTGRGKNYC